MGCIEDERGTFVSAGFWIFSILQCLTRNVNGNRMVLWQFWKLLNGSMYFLNHKFTPQFSYIIWPRWILRTNVTCPYSPWIPIYVQPWNNMRLLHGIFYWDLELYLFIINHKKKFRKDHDQCSTDQTRLTCWHSSAVMPLLRRQSCIASPLPSCFLYCWLNLK